MKALKKTFLVIVIITLTNIFKTSILASSTLNIEHRDIVTVGVLLANFDNSFARLFENALKDIENKPENKIRFISYDAQNNISKQYEQLDSLIRSGVDLLIIKLANLREESIKNVIDKITAQNIPVIFLNVNPSVAAKFSNYYENGIVFVAEDFVKPAALQGRIIVDAWNTNKQEIDKNGDDILQYIMLSSEPGNPISDARTKYPILEINNSGMKTQELALQYAKWDREIAKESVSQMLLKYSGNIEAILAINDNMAIGAIEALQAYGYNKGDKSKNILVVGFDGSPEAKDLIDKGFMTGTVTQDPTTLSHALYSIGMNLINHKDPLENTNYKLSGGNIVLEFPHYKYVNKSNIS